MSRKTNLNSIEVDSNGGGDYLAISYVGSGLIHLASGHCCVSTIDANIPIEVLTAVISKWMLTNNNNIEQAIRDAWKGNPENAENLVQKYRNANPQVR